MKKLLIRAIGIMTPKKGNYIQGIGRSNIEILRGLIGLNDPDIELSIYCNQARRPFYNFKEWPIKHHKYILPYGLNRFCNIEQLWRKYIMGYDLLHITDNFDKVDKNEKFIVTIHDMFRYEESPWVKERFHDMGNYSQGIVTDSEYSKQEIVKKLNVSPDKVKVILLGINHSTFYPRPEEEIALARKKYNIPEKYFFVCSCAHPRKNARDILKSFRIFKETDKETALVLTWSHVPQDILDEYRDDINDGRIIFLDFVTDDELAQLYSGALASFLVSSLEGFGFPILESMACGTQCITCKNSSMTELGADKAYWVEEHNINEIAGAMAHFSKNGKGNTAPLIQYAKTYTWERTAKEYLDYYKKFL